MKTALTSLAGLLVGVVLALGILAAFVLVGPDPAGPRPTPSPTLVPPSVAPSPSPSAAPASVGPSGAPGSGGPSAPAGSPSGSIDPSAAFHIGQPAPTLDVPQVGGGTIDLAGLRGKAVWLMFMRTTCAECVAAVPLVNGFVARYSDKGLVVIAIDIREDEVTVANFANRLHAQFPLGLDTDGKAQQTWGASVLPTHFFIDKDGIVRAGALGGVGPDVFATDLKTILPGVNVTP